MISFIHTADVHIGMENYGKLDPLSGIHTRLLDFEHALEYCISYAIDHHVSCFILAGDAYKTAYPTPTHQRILCTQLLRLTNKNIPIIMVTGNHDIPNSAGKTHALNIYAQMPQGLFYIMSHPQRIVIPTKDGPVQIVGIPWPSRSLLQLKSAGDKNYADISEELSHKVSILIDQLRQECTPEIPTVLVGHLTVSSGIFSGSEKRAIYGNDPVIMPSALAQEPFDYVALGHLHRYQNLNPNGYPAVVYSGSLERIDFGERKDTKGFCHVTIADKNKACHTFIPTPTRPFIQVDVQLSPHDDFTQQVLSALSLHTIENAVIKITYTIPEEHTDTVDKQAIAKACQMAHVIAGIIPIRKHTNRLQRAHINTTMSAQEMLIAYAKTKELSEEQQTRILTKIALLQNEGFSA